MSTQTRRAWTYQSSDAGERSRDFFFGQLFWHEESAREEAPATCPVAPVLVVPESAATDCKHADAVEHGAIWCALCGARRFRHSNKKFSLWTRPRILRVSR